MARSMSVLDSKRKEYVFNDNPFQNFEEGVGLSVVETREAVTYGYAVKHLQSVRAVIQNFESNGTLPDKEVIQEKFGDAINYLIILEQMLLEHLED
jgi:cyanate lyase